MAVRSLARVVLAASLAIALPCDIAVAGQNCLELEGLNLGCVSSVDHSCFRNVSVDLHNAPCYYVGDPATFYRVEGPIAWSCKSSRSTTVCTESEGGETTGQVCTTHSECTSYFDPSCQETCVPCFRTVVAASIGVSQGCIICTREKCPDEPLVVTDCPATYNGLVHGSSQQCSSDSHCPDTLTDPLGVSHPVHISVGSCQPPELPVPIRKFPEMCPWKVDMRSATGCEPISPENMNTP